MNDGPAFGHETDMADSVIRVVRKQIKMSGGEYQIAGLCLFGMDDRPHRPLLDRKTR